MKAIIWIEGHITSDTTWSPVDTYRVINDTYVDLGVTLTILSGVHVQFADGFSLIIEGNLNATGTDVDPIVFTSSRVTPSAGVWNTIDFKGALSCSFVFEHVRVEYAVNGITVESQGSTTVVRSEFYNCSESGIMIKGTSNTTIEENTIKYNKNGIATANYDTCTGVLIAGNVISFNTQNGIYFYGGYMSGGSAHDITFSSNTILSNGGDGVNVFVKGGIVYNVLFSSNTFSNNTGSGISWHTDSTIAYNVAFSSNTASTNTGNGIYCYVYFSTLYNVTFSSNNVSSNGDGIHIHGVGIANMSIIFSSNIVTSNMGSGIYLWTEYESSATFDMTALGNVVSANKQKGLYLGGRIKSNVTENSIAYNQYGVFYENTTGNAANRNDIYSNTYGMNVTAGATVNAEYDYWGDSTGPYNLSVNPEGVGNPVNGNGADLDFIPFLTSPQGHINQLPVAVLSVDKTNVGVNETVTLNAADSTDDGRIDYYFFDFGDGTNSSWTTLYVVTHEYTIEGIYNITLIVMDDFGATSSDTQSAVVQVIVVPELPSFLVLPFFMIVTALAVVICARSRSLQSSLG